MKVWFDQHTRTLSVDGLPLDQLSPTEIDRLAQHINQAITPNGLKETLAEADSLDLTAIDTAINFIEAAIKKLDNDDPADVRNYLSIALDETYAAAGDLSTAIDTIYNLKDRLK